MHIQYLKSQFGALRIEYAFDYIIVIFQVTGKFGLRLVSDQSGPRNGQQFGFHCNLGKKPNLGLPFQDQRVEQQMTMNFGYF